MQGEQRLSSVHSLRQDQMEVEMVGFAPPGKVAGLAPTTNRVPDLPSPQPSLYTGPGEPFRGHVPKLSINPPPPKKNLSRAHWNCEKQNKVLEFSIIINYCSIINSYYNYN